MKKYKYTNNGTISYINVSDDRLEAFLKLHPDATVVGEEVDFQIDPANAETSAGSETNTVSNSDNGLLESREIARDNTAVARNKFIDPIKIIQDREVKEKYEDYRGEIKTQADNLYNINASEMPVTDWGSLDFDKPEEIKNFRSKTTTEFVQKNPIIQNKIVPRVVKSIEPQLDLYIANAKEKYDLIDPNNITQENIDLFNKDVQSYYGDLMNTALASDFQFKNVMTDFEEDFQSRLGSDHSKYIRDVHTPEWMKQLELGGKKLDDSLPDVMGLGQIENLSKIPKIFYNWGKSFNTSAQKTALGLTAREQAERDKSLQRNQNLASKYNWSEDTVGYVVDDPTNIAQSMRFRPKQMSSIGYADDDGIIANWNQGKEMTWKEFQELYVAKKDERVNQMNTRAVKLLEDDIIAAAYDNNAFDKLSEGIEISKNVGALVTEQLPNMVGAVLTMGALPAIQIGGDVYWDQIQNKAREIREANAKAQGLVLTEEELYSPVSPEEMIFVLEDDDFADSAAMRAVSGGFIGGQLERIGAAKVFKPFAIKGVASILRGGSKKIIRNVLATGGNMGKGGFSEALTEIGQDLVQSVASGNELNTENMFEAGATGFIVGAVLPGVAAVKSQSVAEFKTIANVIAGRLNPKSTEAYFNGQLKQLDNLITNEADPAVQQDLQNKRDALLEVRNANTKIPGDFSNDSKKRSLDLLIEKNQKEKEIKDKDKSLVSEQLERIAEIDLELKNISDTDALTKKVLKANKKGDLGITIIEAKDATDAKKQAENNKMNLGEDANSTGYTSQDGKTIIVDMSKAAELGEVNTAAHEMLHAVLFKTLYTINDSGNVEGKNVVRGLAQALQTELNSLDPDIIKTPELAERLRLYQKEPSSVKAEEVLTLFADALFYGDIQYNDGIFTKLGDILRRLLQNAGLKDIEFNSGQDVYNFLKDYNKGVSRGNLGKAINKASKEGAVVGKKIKRFTGPEAVQRTKENKSTAALAKTKDKFKSLEDNFQSGSAQNAIASELFNMVDTQIGNRFNLRPQVKQDLRDDVIERIYKAQETTKWDGRGDLYGFINGRIAKRILDAVRSDSTYLENVDNNQFEQLEKAANEIAEDKSTVQKSKPQYKSLSKSGILSSEAISNINSKILRTVRTLKSKIDEKISKNRTITPLISEIKKDMGKQADIDLKKAIGGIKDGAIQKFLTRNKKAILENMTTTWLMGAIPSSIQKQVDGKFISNWQGQKIDRETVGTDNAGRTSGAEITRRKPNVGSMSDAEFISYFVADGKLIRGRKESLAKAMAEEISLEVFNNELQNEDSDISKAFEQNQSLKGVQLLDNYVAEVSKQTERGNVKFSKSLNRSQAKLINSKRDVLINKILDANINLTKKRLLPMLQDTYPELSTKVLEEFASESIKSINTFVKKIDITKNLDFIKFLTESDILKSENLSLMKVFGLEGSARQLFENSDNISSQRGMEYGFNSDLVSKEGADGLIKILKWGRGHQTTAGKIADGRDQAYAGNADYIINNLNNIPGVEVKWNKKTRRINDVIYNKESIDNWKEKISSPTQIANGGIQKFRDEADVRKEEALEAWNYLNEFLSYVDSNGTMLDWAMAMQSLKSGMSAVLKAAAPVKYHFTGDYKGKLRYEHVIPTKEMIVRLTNYYKNGKGFDLDTLRDKYTVAIVPVVMDNNFNVLVSAQMNSTFDLINDPEYKRYFNENTLGYPNMFPIEVLEGDNKGDIQGKAWVDFNNVLKPYAAKHSRSAGRADKAMNAARLPDYSNNPKGISVYDFDDTLAFSKSKIIVTMPNGKVTKITPAEFAAKDETLSNQGAEFDFSEFNKVVSGTKGPLAARLEKAISKFGNKNIYVLTARPQESAPAIYEFLKGIGLEIPLENITGLQDGRPSAKADWMVNKFAEGYNDFYFVDDAYKNVKAVQDVLSVLDVKSKVQLARAKFSKSLNRDFNDMIARNKGVKSEAQFSEAVARKRGANTGKYRWFIPSSADDFRGLTQYTFAGKGKQGEADQAFFEKALMDPYFAGVSAIESSRQMMKNAYANLLKQMKPVRKKLGKLIPDTSYTYDQAIRVYLWNKAGYDIPGLSKRDLKKLIDTVKNDSDLSAFADGALLSSKQEQWSEPSEHWQAGTILRDLNNLTEKVNRKEYLGEFISNSEILFSSENMNKIEAIYGSRHREALEDALYRMRNGTNRPSGGNRLTNAWNNWVNNSVGTIMFFNRRSALLQLLSTVNFINWSDNNPLKASIAFANQPQYWKDWVRIFNSDKLKQRRGGLKSDIQEQEIASQAKNSKDKSSAIIAYLLKIGFTPTQIADSMAIASGGATFYRNRINTYIKQGLSKTEAEAKAWGDFSKISDEAQQSGDPALVSQQQASVLGRLVLAFQNTPMQYTRLIKKAGLDIINRRGDFKTNFSKIIYYGAVQNFIFSALQNALFAMIPGFDDEEETEEKRKLKEDQKTGRIIHSMVDTILRGSGLAGAVASTAKNTIRKFVEQDKKGFTADHTYTIIEAANISPPIGSKLRKLYGAIQTWKFDKDVIKERGFDVTLEGKLNISPTYNIIGNLTSALINLPLDRALMEVSGIVEALDERNTLYQRIALALGWRSWGVGAENEEHDLIKAEAKIRRKAEGKIKAKETRENNKKEEARLRKQLKDYKEYQKYKAETKGMSVTNRIEWLKKFLNE